MHDEIALLLTVAAHLPPAPHKTDCQAKAAWQPQEDLKSLFSLFLSTSANARV
jgi:hypothetical protein